MLTVTATNLPRVMNCNGSAFMQSDPSGEKDTSARDEGNAAHYAASQIFNGVTPATLINQAAYNGYTMTASMIDHVSEYVSALDCGDMEIETTWRGAAFTINGRADHVHYNQFTGMLTIDDFKYGWRIVEPERHWTLISHAIGYCIRLGIRPTSVVFRIHQPRPLHQDGKLRTWVIDGPYLDVLRGEIETTLTYPNDQLVTDIDWCAKCHAHATCPAARKASMNGIDASSHVFNDTITNPELFVELDNLTIAYETIELRLNALKELAAHRVTLGQVIESQDRAFAYGSKTSYANRAWKAGVTPDMAHVITGYDLSERSMITPAAAERLGVDKTVVDTLTSRAVIGTKLTRIDVNKHAMKLLKR